MSDGRTVIRRDQPVFLADGRNVRLDRGGVYYSDGLSDHSLIYIIATVPDYIEPGNGTAQLIADALNAHEPAKAEARKTD